ncbi:MAG: hypothetical protein E6K10_07340 [Methanobacteriota archaeon]|nr:MAG: hypothetical protein E6K10_07340 [Euryarchaeota archaeon]
MGYFMRRIVGYIVFLSVLGLLSTTVVNADNASGGTLLSGTSGAATGVSVLLIALLCSWGVRWEMRRRTKRTRLRRLSIR